MGGFVSVLYIRSPTDMRYKWTLMHFSNSRVGKNELVFELCRRGMLSFDNDYNVELRETRVDVVHPNLIPICSTVVIAPSTMYDML